MVDFAEGLADWGIKQVVNDGLEALVKDGTITISNEATVDQAAIILTNAILQKVAEKVGASAPDDDNG